MYEELVATQFSFLAAGPTFTADMPSGFGRVPELTAPIDNGVGGRAFTFFPMDFDLNDGSVFQGSVTDKDGRSVEVFLRPGDEPLWWMKWTLSEGVLFSHLRVEDGEDMAQQEAACVSIVETSGASPTMLLDPPLRLVVNDAPEWQDIAQFFPAEGNTGTWGIGFRRPALIAAGEIFEFPADEGQPIVRRAGTSLGLEVVVTAPDRPSCEYLMSACLDSLAQAS